MQGMADTCATLSACKVKLWESTPTKYPPGARLLCESAVKSSSGETEFLSPEHIKTISPSTRLGFFCDNQSYRFTSFTASSANFSSTVSDRLLKKTTPARTFRIDNPQLDRRQNRIKLMVNLWCKATHSMMGGPVLHQKLLSNVQNRVT